MCVLDNYNVNKLVVLLDQIKNVDNCEMWISHEPFLCISVSIKQQGSKQLFYSNWIVIIIIKVLNWTKRWNKGEGCECFYLTSTS